MIEGLYINQGIYADFPDTSAAYENVYSVYWNNPKFEDIRYDLDCAILQAFAEYEKQGFIYGFRKAIELLELEKSPLSDTNTSESKPKPKSRLDNMIITAIG